MYVYDPGTNSWGTDVDLPSEYSCYNPGAATLGPDGTKIFVLGGYNAFSGLGIKSSYVFDPTAPPVSAWTKRGDLPLGRTSMAATSGADGRVYSMGGADAGANGFAEVDAYTPATNAWSVVAPLPSAFSMKVALSLVP